MKPIVLVGLPGVGKTTIGEALAARLSLPFLDSDREIERRTGQSVEAIFRRGGEAQFRAIERAVAAELASGADRVIALGGGTFQDENIRALVLAHCTAVWLDLPHDALLERLRTSPPRPLFAGRNYGLKLQELRLARSTAFAEAHARVTGSTPARAVDAIVRFLEKSGAEVRR